MKYVVRPVFSNAQNFPGIERSRRYLLTSVKSGLVATLQAGKALLMQYRWSESSRQQWILESLEGADAGYFKIINHNTGKVLDVRGGSTDASAEVIEWSWHGGHNQQWKLVYIGTSKFRIECRKSGLVLDVSGGEVTQGAKIIQSWWHGGENQQWLITEATENRMEALSSKVKIFDQANFAGASHEVGIGSYDIDKLGIGGDKISSLKVPAGLRVTLYEHPTFRGRGKKFLADASYVGDDFNNIASSMLVEVVATVYDGDNFQGETHALGIGRYNVGDLGIGGDRISSIRVPQGLMVTIYDHPDFKGKSHTYFDDIAVVGELNNRASSLIVKMIGVKIPDGVLRFGTKIALKSKYSKWLVAESDGRLNANRDAAQEWEHFTLARSGATKHLSYISFGDTVSLKSAHNQWVTAASTGEAFANRNEIGPDERWTIVRAGKTAHNGFVSAGDQIALLSVSKQLYLCGQSDGFANANQKKITPTETWLVTDAIHPPPTDGGSSTSVCGAEACATDTCGAAACGAAAALVGVCGAAASGIAICGADVSLVGVCGAAACGAAGGAAGACGAAVGGVGVCGGDACGAAACGAAACGVAASGIGVCGADACGAAACGAAACGAAACGAAACGAAACPADACATDSCGAEACSAEACAAEACGAEAGQGACAADAGGIDACQADACAANACAINLCPADACAADACAIDVIPIIPFI